MISIDLSGLHNDVTRYMRRMQEEVDNARQVGAETLAERLRERARQIPEWSSLADDIHVWSQDGRLVVGMLHQDMVSQAFAVEYGDETRPPTPLFRNASGDVHEASQAATQYFMGAMK